ncbi:MULTISPECIES: hypothetical protein [Micrococcaceae]|uniref:hypothetical protein n=1 Tax=unclassified Kocuria TaxID=2649579 RepID=UPI0010134C8C|nr:MULTISPECIES: hypothetical protein [unclassified Kocuria]
MSSSPSSHTPPRDSSDSEPKASNSSAPRSESRAFTWFAGLAGVIALLCVVSGVVMLVLKWMGLHPWSFLTQLPLIFLPIAFILLIIALVLAARRRRSL